MNSEMRLLEEQRSARKAAVGYVLSGKKAGLDELCLYCDEENLSSQKVGRRIGFQS